MWSCETFAVDNFCTSMVPNSSDCFAFRGASLGKCSMQHET